MSTSSSEPDSTLRRRDHDEPAPVPPPKNSFDLEPNPFERSFSVSSSSLYPLRKSIAQQQSTSSTSTTTIGTANGTAHSKQPSSDDKFSRKSPSSENTPAGASSGSAETPKPMLPPIEAITSPSDPSYAWALSSGLNSLRSGPLSPAMLAGPRPQSQSTHTPSATSSTTHHLPLLPFDPSGSFRTGLTPSTGLTPLVGGPVAFPPTSPNTAAFLAMVGSGGATANTATITPNTLNALTGVLNGTTTAATTTTNSSNGASTNGNSNGVNGTTNGSQTRYNYNQSPPQQSQQVNNPANPSATSTSTNTQSSQQNNNYINVANATATAANGLFLLSQAHQELTKREEEALKSQRANSNAVMNGTSNNQIPQANGVGVPKRGAKRKSTASSIDTSATVVNNRGANKRTRTTSSRGRSSVTTSGPGDEDEDDEDDGDDDDIMGDSPELRHGTAGLNKKPETEEEKRKNFLERNRQAALKCRQRKKAWLAQLQAKVEFLSSENERLTAALVASREEVTRLSAIVGGVGVGVGVGMVNAAVGVPGVVNGMNGMYHQPPPPPNQQHHSPPHHHSQQQQPTQSPIQRSPPSHGLVKHGQHQHAHQQHSQHQSHHQQHHQSSQQQQSHHQQPVSVAVSLPAAHGGSPVHGGGAGANGGGVTGGDVVGKDVGVNGMGGVGGMGLGHAQPVLAGAGGGRGYGY